MHSRSQLRVAKILATCKVSRLFIAEVDYTKPSSRLHLAKTRYRLRVDEVCYA